MTEIGQSWSAETFREFYTLGKISFNDLVTVYCFCFLEARYSVNRRAMLTIAHMC